jgi:cellulose synthase/poly-beta-1,6-N-acetylglucosamine synthase-like glycosyltransferase
MEIINKILLVPEIVMMAYLGLAAIYFFVFAIASRFYSERKDVRTEKKYRVTVLIPSFSEDDVIVETARSAMDHRSYSSVFEVLVIADSLRPETIMKIHKTGARVLPVSFDESTKSKSIIKGLELISGNCDYVIILDADNIMEDGFIDRLLEVTKQGFSIVQGHRTAKNSNTELAVLDGISEEVNNAIFRKGHRVLGLSASLIGSAFICEYKLFKELMDEIKAVGGFDKELELMLLEKKIKIAYANHAIVYDEKVQLPGTFVNQRRRWLSAQFIFFGKNIGNWWKQLIRFGNIDYFDKLLQFILPPRLVTVGLAFLLTVSHLLFNIITENDKRALLYASATLLGISLLAIILAIPFKKFNRSLFRSLWFIPAGFILILKALFKVRGANKKFIHTPHSGSN